MAEGTDWESIQSKYSDILEWMLEDYPEISKAASELNKDYSHKRSEITKQVLMTKLKAIRIKFRQAVDTRRKSGSAKVVFLYYDLCESIWGGSPAMEQLPSWLESTDTEHDGTETLTDASSSAGSLNTSIVSSV